MFRVALEPVSASTGSTVAANYPPAHSALQINCIIQVFLAYVAVSDPSNASLPRGSGDARLTLPGDVDTAEKLLMLCRDEFDK